MFTTRQRGSHYERLAARFLRSRGLTFIENNYLCRSGEIDLIMGHRRCLVFVEVRFRDSASHGSALETITVAKRKKIIMAAKLYLCEKGLYDKVDCRFDVVGVCISAGKPEFEWVTAAFS